jgi:radical SAM protein with 4Fe4S-binding SPASM domain
MNISKISLIIPTRNCSYLEKILPKLDLLFEEIIVVGESNLNFNNFKNVKYFYNHNANAATNRNFGSEKAKNEYLFFLDSDCLPTDDLISELSFIKLDKNKIIAGYYADESVKNLISDSISKFISFRLRNQTTKCVKFSSANFIIGKEFFKKIGKFNEHLDCYEDVDLNIRAHLFKGKVVNIEKFTVFHLKQYSLITLLKETYIRSYKSAGYIFNNKKYFSMIGLNFPLISFNLIYPHIFFILTFFNSFFFIPLAGILLINTLIFKKIFKNFKNSFSGTLIIGTNIIFNIFGYFISLLNSYFFFSKDLIKEVADYFICLKRALIKSKYPVQLIQYVTARCNLRCDHCFYKNTLDAKDPGEIDVDTLISRTENLAPFLWYSITGGEVFIRKDFEKLVLEIQNKLRPKFFSFPTNGWYTKRTFEGVLHVLQRLKRGNLILFFSIDGTEDMHDKIRGPNSYKKLKETIEYLKILQQVYPRLYVNIVITVQYQNYKLFPDLIQDIQNEFDPTAISINLLRYHSLHGPKLEPHILEAYENAINEYDKIRNKNKYNFLMNSVIKAKEKNQKKIILNAAKFDKFTTPCSAGNLSYVIMENGELKPCEILENSYGNIKESKVEEIISNKNTLAKENRKWIKDTNCRCTYECANSTNALFNTNMLPGLIKTIYSDFFKKTF